MPKQEIRSSSFVSELFISQIGCLYFSDAGHGTQVVDTDGDEADGWDEGGRLRPQGGSIPNSLSQQSFLVIMNRREKSLMT